MKSIVITGSTRGIGFGLADAFLALGCQVMISGRAQASVDRAVADLAARHAAGRITGFPCNVTHIQELQALWDAARARFGDVDIWINNAGVSNARNDYWDLDPQDARCVIETNVIGSMYGCTVALRGMRAQGHGALYNLEGLGSSGGNAPHLQVFGTGQFRLHGAPPDFSGLAKAVQHHRIGLATGFEQRLVFGLTDFNPEPRAPGVVAQPDVGLIRIRQSGAKAERAVAAAHRLQLVRLQGQRT